MRGKDVLFSSKSHDWSTPFDLFDELDCRFNFTLDPCASHENAKCKKYFTEETDGLAQSWQGERVFMNPPYGNEIKFWIAKAVAEWRLGGCLVVALLPARTDTKWWQSSVLPFAAVRFLPGRLKFGGSSNAAPFPSALALYW